MQARSDSYCTRASQDQQSQQSQGSRGGRAVGGCWLPRPRQPPRAVCAAPGWRGGGRRPCNQGAVPDRRRVGGGHEGAARRIRRVQAVEEAATETGGWLVLTSGLKVQGARRAALANEASPTTLRLPRCLTLLPSHSIKLVIIRSSFVYLKPAVDDCLLNQVLPRCYHGWVDGKTSFLRLSSVDGAAVGHQARV